MAFQRAGTNITGRQADTDWFLKGVDFTELTFRSTASTLSNGEFGEFTRFVFFW